MAAVRSATAPLRATPGSHVRLYPLTLDGVEMVDGPQTGVRTTAVQFAALWVGLARAALDRTGENTRRARDGACRRGARHRRASARRSVRPGDRRLPAADRRGAPVGQGRRSAGAPTAHLDAGLDDAARHAAPAPGDGRRHHAAAGGSSRTPRQAWPPARWSTC